MELYGGCAGPLPASLSDVAIEIKIYPYRVFKYELPPSPRRVKRNSPDVFSRCESHHAHRLALHFTG